MEKHVNKTLSERFAEFSGVAKAVLRLVNDTFSYAVKLSYDDFQRQRRFHRMSDPNFSEAEAEFKKSWDDFIDKQQHDIAKERGGEAALPATYLPKGQENSSFIDHVTYYYDKDCIDCDDAEKNDDAYSICAHD